jgi:hypothetical protein
VLKFISGRYGKIVGSAILALFLTVAIANAQDDTLRVLFIGNSHTYYNDLPQLFVDLSASGGHPAVKDMSAPGGYTLEQHTTNANTLSKIALGNWDYVVLQEHSLYPVIDFYRYGSMYPAARLLDSLITSYGQQTALYMTWGWRNGGAHSVDGHFSPDFVDFFHMQDSVSAAYNMLANELNATLVPCGNAWATAWAIDSSNTFWQEDTYHPTLIGSYLAACVFYFRLFHESPVGLPFTAGIDSSIVAFLQSAAEQTVLSTEDGFEYSLKTSANVTMEIYDLLGRKIDTILDEFQTQGDHRIVWDAHRCPTGIYFYRIVVGDYANSKSMILLK